MNVQAEHVSGGEGDVRGMSYACTQARLHMHMTKTQAKHHAHAHWLYRITDNVAIEAVARWALANNKYEGARDG